MESLLTSIDLTGLGHVLAVGSLYFLVFLQDAEVRDLKRAVARLTLEADARADDLTAAERKPPVATPVGFLGRLWGRLTGREVILLERGDAW